MNLKPLLTLNQLHTTFSIFITNFIFTKNLRIIIIIVVIVKHFAIFFDYRCLCKCDKKRGDGLKNFCFKL